MANQVVNFKSLAMAVIAVAIMTNSCSRMSASNRIFGGKGTSGSSFGDGESPDRPRDEGVSPDDYNTGSLPNPITGVNLADLSSNLRCSHAQKPDKLDVFIIICRIVSTVTGGGEEVATAFDKGVSAQWLPPDLRELKAGTINFCAVAVDQLSQRCEVSLTSLSQIQSVTLGVSIRSTDTNPTEPPIALDRFDRVTLPFGIDTLGYVPELALLKRLDNQNTINPPSHNPVIAATDPVPQESSKLFDQNIWSYEYKSFPVNAHPFAFTTSLCVLDDTLYVYSGRSVYAVRNGNAAVYAGSTNTKNKSLAFPRRHFFLGLNGAIACDGSNLYASLNYSGNQAGGMVKIMPSNAVVAIPSTTTAIRLISPQGIAVASNGDLIVADPGDKTVKVVKPDGTIALLAGSAVGSMTNNGILAINARFRFPEGIAIDKAGNVYVSDSILNLVRKIKVDGTISTVAGVVDQSGFSAAAGIGAEMDLNGPQGLAINSKGILYIADRGNRTIRRLDTVTGTMTTVAGQGPLGAEAKMTLNSLRTFRIPHGVFHQPVPTAPAAATSFDIGDPTAISVAPDDSLLIATDDTNAIWTLGMDGRIVPIAGQLVPLPEIESAPIQQSAIAFPYATQFLSNGDMLFADGGWEGTRLVHVNASGAQNRIPFDPNSMIVGIATLNGTNTFLADFKNNRILRFDLPSIPDGTDAALPNPRVLTSSGLNLAPTLLTSLIAVADLGIAADLDGSILVPDRSNHRIVRITGEGTLSTVAGADPIPDSNDSTKWIGVAGNSYIGKKPSEALFAFPNAVLRSVDGTLFVADLGNNQIKRITPGSEGNVELIAGPIVAETPRNPRIAIAKPSSLAWGPGEQTLYVVDGHTSAPRVLEFTRPITTGGSWTVQVLFGGTANAACGAGSISQGIGSTEIRAGIQANLAMICPAAIHGITSVDLCKTKEKKFVLAIAQTFNRSPGSSNIVRIERPCD